MSGAMVIRGPLLPLHLMTTYFHFSTYLAHQHLISIEMRFALKKAQTLELELPAWRPGRYELGEYAMNIKYVNAQIGDKDIALKKTSRNVWSLENCPAGEVILNYLYYADTVNGGSCYIDEDLLYVNPVNCCFKVKGQKPGKVKVSLDVPKDFKHAGMLPIKANKMTALDMDTWYDSPFASSRKMKTVDFEVGGVKTSLAFQGNVPEAPADLEKIFKAFMLKQIKAFGSCPVKDYTYLVLCTAQRYYHGVEHEHGTVIALGPDHSIFKGSVFQDLLGVSSHEFYHTWNVKYMRPEEMWPYDFTKENYHRIGYIIEGITTYQGDVKLWQSGVLNDEQFFSEMKTHLDRHHANLGRNHLSIRESSFDLWVDGYKPGIADRKVSIYTEGALIALMIEMMVLEATQGKSNLDAVMQALYVHCESKGRGYSETDFLNILSFFIGPEKCKKFFKETIDSTGDLHSKTIKALQTVGVDVKENDSDVWAAKFGLKFTAEPQPKVTHVHTSSQAYEAGIRPGMTLISLDGIWIENDFIHMAINDEVSLQVREGKVLKNISLSKSKESYYLQFDLSRSGKKGQALWKSWKS